MSEVYKIVANEEMLNLGQSNNFSVELWENLLGKKLTKLVEEALNQTGNGHLKQKFDTAVVETESFLGTEWSKLLQADQYDFLQEFNNQPGQGFSISTLNSSKIVFQFGDIEFSLTGQNFSVDLQKFANSFASGTQDTDFPTWESLSLIDGFVSKIEITDKTTGVDGVPSVSFALNSPNTDSNIQDAEHWSLNLQDQVHYSWKTVRDISGILEWLNSGLGIDAL